MGEGNQQEYCLSCFFREAEAQGLQSFMVNIPMNFPTQVILKYEGD